MKNEELKIMNDELENSFVTWTDFLLNHNPNVQVCDARMPHS